MNLLPFAGDGVAIGKFEAAFYENNKFAPEEFQNRQNIFAKRNVTATVLEIPTTLIGQGKVRSWATSSLYSHAPETQVSRWGWPLLTHTFLLPNVELSEAFNRGVPAQDVARFAAHVEDFATQLTTLAGSAGDPAEYARQLSAKLLPNVLPYELGTSAAFDFAAVNRRALSDDVMDVILTQATNTALSDGVSLTWVAFALTFPILGRRYRTRSRPVCVPPSRESPVRKRRSIA